METSNLEIKVTKAKADGASVSKTIAFVQVKCGPLWANFRLDRSDKGGYFLNAPAAFRESMKGRPQKNGKTHSGFMEFAGLSSQGIQEVKTRILEELGLERGA